MEAKREHTYSIRNVEDGQTVSLTGDGEFCIGLTLDERVICSSRLNASAKSKPVSQNEDDIVVPLMMLTVWKTSGVSVSPASRDLKCKLNGEDIGIETHFIPGSRLEVGDKIFELIEGKAAKLQRRHLPPTPGVPILPCPPPKPQRLSMKPALSDAGKDQSRNALRNWCLIELPNSEHELLQQTKEPNQLANLASSYLTRHINVHTDVVMSADLTDRIFRGMQEVAQHRRDILRSFLSEVITEVVEESKEGQDSTHHATVTNLLVEILQQFLDPGYLVLLCLQLLRALSHIPGNVGTMVVSNTTAAVLGSMAAYKDEAKIQSNSLDILAKMATFTPAVLEKPPMRESSIDLVSMALTMHSNNLTVIQAAVRTLANLASMFHSLASAIMADSPKPDLQTYLSLVVSVLDYLYNKTLSQVRDALGIFCADLTVKTDGRRYLFEYAKMDQLRSQQKLWNLTNDAVEPAHTETDDISCDNQCQLPQNCDSCDDDEKLMNSEINGSSTLGILKKSRSFENLRTPVRRVSFVNENELSSTNSSSNSSVVSTSGLVEQDDIPDIQILSFSRIYPDHVDDVVDGDDVQTFINGEQEDSASAIVDTSAKHANGLPDNKATNAEVNSKEEWEIKTKPVQQEISFSNIPSTKVFKKDVHTSSSNGTTESELNSQEQSSNSHKNHPTDLTCFRYTAADIIYMKKLMNLQVTCHVCSASVQGLDPPALKLIDLPLSQLFCRPGIPKAMWQFVSSQFEEQVTLMDIDPGTVISIIDAVRYKILIFDLVKKSLELLIQSLSSNIHPVMLEVTAEVIETVLTDAAFSPIAADQQFFTDLGLQLENLKKVVHDPQPVVYLIDVIRSRSQQQDQHRG